LVNSYAVLLRAVNVGGRTLSMDRLRRVLTTMGCSTATTLGVSGNAVVTYPGGTSTRTFERKIEEALALEAGVSADAFVRDGREWDQLVRENPFRSEAREDPAHLVVTVLRSAPRASAWTRLSGGIVGREQVRPGTRHAYIVYPDGIGRSKLTATRIERLLGVRGTSRNWNTVLRLWDELHTRAERSSTLADPSKKI